MPRTSTYRKRKKAPATKAGLPMPGAPSFHERVSYHIDDLARHAVLEHPSVQKRLDRTRAKIYKTVMTSKGGMGNMFREEDKADMADMKKEKTHKKGKSKKAGVAPKKKETIKARKKHSF